MSIAYVSPSNKPNKFWRKKCEGCGRYEQFDDYKEWRKTGRLLKCDACITYEEEPEYVNKLHA